MAVIGGDPDSLLIEGLNNSFQQSAVQGLKADPIALVKLAIKLVLRAWKMSLMLPDFMAAPSF